MDYCDAVLIPELPPWAVALYKTPVSYIKTRFAIETYIRPRHQWGWSGGASSRFLFWFGLLRSGRRAPEHSKGVERIHLGALSMLPGRIFSALFEKVFLGDVKERLLRELRPEAWKWGLAEGAAAAYPIRPISLGAMYQLYEESDVLRPIIITLKNEVFRTGLTAAPRFVVRCVDCGTEYQSDIAQCDSCGSDRLTKPNWVERQEMMEWLKSVNANGQSLKEICKECEKDLDICDDAWLVCIKHYILDESGRIVDFEPVELVRGDPRIMRLVIDKAGNLGGKWWICLEHRSPQDVQTQPGKCPRCGKMLYEVKYVALDNEAGSPKVYYIEGEVLHWSKYDPSLTYGTPPLVTLWQATQTLKSMSEYLNLMFQGQRCPRRFIWMVTKNVDGLHAWWKQQLDECKRDRFYVPVIAVEGETKEGSVGIVDAMDSLQDIQFLAQKEELRQRLSAFYGVSNIFQADVKMAGGLNNESRQIMVTDRAVELARAIYREKVFPWVCKQYGFVDFVIDFHLLDERDEATRLALDAKRISNMSAMVAAGFTAERQPDGSFKFSGLGQRARSIEPREPEAPHLEVPGPEEAEASTEASEVHLK